MDVGNVWSICNGPGKVMVNTRCRASDM
jgi:hypothetical protein